VFSLRNTITTKSIYLHAVGYHVKVCSRNDYKTHVENVAWKAQAASAKPYHDSKTLFACAKQLSKKSTRVPKSIKTSSGRMAQNRAEIATRWSEHFCNLFLGKQSSWDEVTNKYLSRASSSICDSTPSAGEVIMDQELEHIFSHVKKSAFGPDAIPPETFRVAPGVLARLIGPAFRHFYSIAREPLQFKGGVIIDLLKASGFCTECSGSRGILISNVLGKAYRKCVRNRLVPFAEKYALDSQCGGLCHRGTDFASHMLNTAYDYAKIHRASVIGFFVDVIAAFDSVIHSFIINLEISDESITYLMSRLALPPECFEELCQTIRENSALVQAGVPTHLLNVTEDVLSDNWFLIDNNPEPCTIERSTKQGDPLADILFNFFAARILKSIRSKLSDAGIGLRVPSCDTTLLGHTDQVTFTDASYVDDAFFAHIFYDNMNTMQYISCIVSVVARTLYSHALLPNFKKGKSELSIEIRGKGADAAKKVIFADLNSIVPVKVYDTHTVEVHVVPGYKHLGNQSKSSNSNTLRAKYRVSQGMSAFIPLSKHVLNSRIISLNIRILLASSLIFSKLYFNVATWSFITLAQLGMFHTMYIRVLRSLHRFDWRSPVSDADLMSKYPIPEPSLYIRGARLLYFARFISHAPSTLKSLVASLASSRDSWYMLVFSDLEWLFSVEPKFSHLSLNELSQEQLHNIILAPSWKSIVHGNIERAHQAGYLSVPAPNHAAAQVSCDVCGKVCNNSHVLAGHMHKIHNVRHPARLFAGSEGTCLICLKLFHTRPRLIHHLRQSSKPCLVKYKFYFPPSDPDVVASLDAEDRIQAAKAKRSGQSKLFASIPVLAMHGPLRPEINTDRARHLVASHVTEKKGDLRSRHLL